MDVSKGGRIQGGSGADYLTRGVLDALFDHSSSALELYDGAGGLIDINAGSLGIFGIDDKKEIESFNFFSDPNITPSRKRDIASGKTVAYETTIDFDEVKVSGLFRTRKSGKVSLAVTVVPILDPSGALARILFIGDVLSSRHAHE